MSGLHLVKRGREHKKLDLHRDFTVASPAEFVTRFGGNRVIEKVEVVSVSWWRRAALPAGGPVSGPFFTLRGRLGLPLGHLPGCWVGA